MMGEIIIVGMGPGPVKYLTEEARTVLLAESELYFRQSAHPVYHWLREQGKNCTSFDLLYNHPGITYTLVYQTIHQALVKAARKYFRAVYALPGNPFVFEKTTRSLVDQADAEGIRVRIVPGLSFIEMLYAELKLDPEEGLQVLNAKAFSAYGDYPFTPELGLLIGQVGLPATNEPSHAQSNVDALTLALLRRYPPEHRVTLVWSTTYPDYENRTRTVSLADLPHQTGYVPFLCSLYVPPRRPPWETAKQMVKP